MSTFFITLSFRIIKRKIVTKQFNKVVNAVRGKVKIVINVSINIYLFKKL